jgi:hypothetical protein
MRGWRNKANRALLFLHVQAVLAHCLYALILSTQLTQKPAPTTLESGWQGPQARSQWPR